MLFFSELNAYLSVFSRLPKGELTVDLISRLVGHQHVIPTIDVATQAEGPQWTMEQWRYYWNMPASARKKLLNVVSLGLFGTDMEAQVIYNAGIFPGRRKVPLQVFVWILPQLRIGAFSAFEVLECERNVRVRFGEMII